MTSSLPVYRNILDQAAALEQSIAWHTGPGRAALTKAASLLQQAEQIVVVAIGASYNAALPFVYRLAHAGKQVVLEDAAEFLHYKHSAYSASCVFLLISRSGSTIEITRSLSVLKGRGQTVIGLTNEPESMLALQADLGLRFGGPSDDLIAIQTYLTTLMTLELLSEMMLADVDAAAFRDDLRTLVDGVGRTISTYRQLPPPAVRPAAVYLLGRGAALASSMQGALLFHEMARYPAQGFGAGAFRHGPWEVADERLKAFIFAPLDHTVDLNLALAADLAALHANVTLLSPRPQTEAALLGVELWELAAAGPRWAPFLEIIPLQFYIYQLALLEGHTPGVFRACTPITLSETGSLAGSLKSTAANPTDSPHGAVERR